jgi:hypothetical protein
MEQTTKRCSKCGIIKPITEFYKDKFTKGGMNSRCKECMRIYHHEYYKRNLERRREWQREYYEENEEKIREYRHKYRLKNIEKYREGNRRYERTAKGKFTRKRLAHARRSLKENNENDLTEAQWIEILKQQKNRCNLCGKPFTKRRFPTQDHIISVLYGGGLSSDNVQALCLSCNCRKREKLYPSFIQTWIGAQEHRVLSGGIITQKLDGQTKWDRWL